MKKTVNLELSGVHVSCSHLFEEVVIKIVFYLRCFLYCKNDKNSYLQNSPRKDSKHDRHMHPNAFLGIEGIKNQPAFQ